MRFLLLALFVALLVTGAHADLWGPPEAHTFVSQSGRFHLRVIPARLPPGRRPDVMLPGDRERPAAGENRLAWCQGLLYDGKQLVRTLHLCNKACPLIALVSDDGHHVVTFDNWGYPGYGDDVVAVYADDRLVARHALSKLFSTEQIKQMMHTTSGIHWQRGAWLQSGRRQVVVVGVPAEMRVIDLGTGDIAKGDDSTVLEALHAPLNEVDALPIELAGERKLATAVPALRALMSSQRSDALRVRAAVALAVLGEVNGKQFLAAFVQRKRTERMPDETLRYAVSHLPEALGKDAVPLLRAVDAKGSGAYTALARVIPEGVAVVVDVMLHSRDAYQRASAASALGTVRDRAVIPPLLVAIRSTDEQLADTALRSAISCGGTSIAPELANVLSEGSTQDHMIALFFGKQPAWSAQPDVRLPEVVPALIAALRRNSRESAARSAIVAALQFQTGASLGPDADAWERLSAAGSSDTAKGSLLLDQGDASGLLLLARAATDAAGRRALADAEIRVPRLLHALNERFPLAASFTEDGKFVVVSVEGKPTTVWSAASGLRIDDPGHRVQLGGQRYAVDFDLDLEGTIMGAPDSRKSVRVVDVGSGRTACTLAVPKGAVRARMTGDGERVVVYGVDGTISLWDPTSGRRLTQIQATPEDFVQLDKMARTALVVHEKPDRMTFPKTGADCRVVDLQSGKPLSTFSVVGDIQGSSLTPDGKRILIVDATGTLRIFSSDGRPCGTPQTHVRPPLVKGQVDVPWTHLYQSPDGRLCATVRDSSVRVWRTADATALTPPLSHASEVSEAVFSPDGALLVTTEHDGRIHTWDLRTGREAMVPIQRGRDGLADLAFPSFAPDSRRVVLRMLEDARIYDVVPADVIGVDDDAPVALLMLEASVWTGRRLDGGQAVAMTPAEVAAAQREYEAAAREHAAHCAHPAQNRWMHDSQAAQRH